MRKVIDFLLGKFVPTVAVLLVVIGACGIDSEGLAYIVFVGMTFAGIVIGGIWLFTYGRHLTFPYCEENGEYEDWEEYEEQEL